MVVLKITFKVHQLEIDVSSHKNLLLQYYDTLIQLADNQAAKIRQGHCQSKSPFALLLQVFVVNFKKTHPYDVLDTVY